MKKGRPPSSNQQEKRPARKSKPVDPMATHNRAQKEARLLREKGVRKKFEPGSPASGVPAEKPKPKPTKKFSKPIPEKETRPLRARPEKPAPIVSKKDTSSKDEMRLNKYLAHAGIASRRAVDQLILQGHVTVNGKVIQEMGFKVSEKDVVTFKGKPVKPDVKLVYILLNKPRNVISTVSDERGRKTVMDVIAEKIPERIYPVGRLDRNTSGLILLTNDGELTRKLSHPSYEVPKVYHVTLDKPLSLKDLEKVRKGITLEDGEVKADSLHFMEGESKREVQIEIHSGRNRIVRRIFEHLGYEIVKLDRTYYAGLTKKNLPRGMFRALTKEEVRMLKHFS